MDTLSPMSASSIKPAELPTSTLTGRLHSIDVFRAITMFLMIFLLIIVLTGLLEKWRLRLKI